MPKYRGLYRALTVDYRNYLDTFRGGWPSDLTLQTWFKSDIGYKGGTNTAMRRGEPVPKKYTDSFVKLLVGSQEPLALAQARRATLDYVGRFGIQELTPSTEDAVREHICYPPLPRPSRIRPFRDYLRERTHALQDFLHLAEFENWLRACPPSYIAEAVRWMYVRVAQSTAPTGPSLSHADAIRFAEEYIGLALGDYCERVRRWSEINPWIVLLSWHKDKAVGMHIALPVTPQTYQQIVDGKKTPYDCTEADFTIPSLHLVFESIAEKPEFVGRQEPNPTRSLRASSIFQIAALARCNRLRAPDTLRILTFAGTPLNEERSRSVGFVQKEGRVMRHPNPSTQLKLYELEVQVGRLTMSDIFTVGILELIGARCPSAPALPD